MKLDAAAAAKLFIVTAGAPNAIDTCRPLFETLSQKHFVIGERPEIANLVKLSGNFLLASVIEALGEAMALVGNAGLDRRQYLDFLTATLFPAPVYKTYSALIAEGRFEPAAFAAPLGHKDIRLTLAASRPNASREPPARSLLGATCARRRGARLVGDWGARDQRRRSTVLRWAVEDLRVSLIKMPARALEPNPRAREWRRDDKGAG